MSEYAAVASAEESEKSDHIGRENAMFIAFLIEGLAIWGWLQTIHKPLLFVLLSTLVFFAWGGDLLAVPVDHRRPVWQEVGDHELRNCLHLEGYGIDFCCASRCLRHAEDWIVGARVLRHRKRRKRSWCTLRPEK
jgi:hypothetical protein